MVILDITYIKKESGEEISLLGEIKKAIQFYATESNLSKVDPKVCLFFSKIFSKFFSIFFFFLFLFSNALSGRNPPTLMRDTMGYFTGGMRLEGKIIWLLELILPKTSLPPVLSLWGTLQLFWLCFSKGVCQLIPQLLNISSGKLRRRRRRKRREMRERKPQKPRRGRGY